MDPTFARELLLLVLLVKILAAASIASVLARLTSSGHVPEQTHLTD